MVAVRMAKHFEVIDRMFCMVEFPQFSISGRWLSDFAKCNVAGFVRNRLLV